LLALSLFSFVDSTEKLKSSLALHSSRYTQNDDEQESSSARSSSSSQSSDPLRPRASHPMANYLATSSPAHSQAATHVSNSQPSRPATQVEQTPAETEETEEGASAESSSGRKRERDRLRMLNGEKEEQMNVDTEQRKRLKLGSSHPSSPSKRQVAQTPAVAPSQHPRHSRPPSVVDNSSPFRLDPAQLALFNAEQEYWSRSMELQPMVTVALPPVARRRQRGGLKGCGERVEGLEEG
jgi:hypothetical protein